MDPPEIVFKLQWKRKPGAGGREELASIGIWDLSDPTLALIDFKSYLCQHLGTVADFSVSYMDNEGDELPIDSDCEFQEALKFAKMQACKGKHTVLKLDRHSSPSSVAMSYDAKRLFGSRSRDWKCKSGTVTQSKSDLRKDNRFRMGSKYAFQTADDLNATQVDSEHVAHMMPPGPPRKFRFYKSGKDKSSSSEDKQNKWRFSSELENVPKAVTESVTQLLGDQDQDQLRKQTIENDDIPPAWFQKYMQKMKMEIVGEVTANMLLATRQLIVTKLGPSPCPCTDHSKNTWSTGKPKKKRISDEDSSDANINSHQREHKLLKKIEKLHKQERKLDSKLEKLESKTKRRIEKKTQPKNRVEAAVIERKSSRKRSSDGPAGTYLMDAILLNDGARHFEPLRTRPGERCTKVWEIMNNGTLPWTDKTELRLAWGTPCLEPEKSVVKCPILQPGENGKIVVNFAIPDFPGAFESYWHFYHMGDRFGHWIGCAVIVECEDQKLTEEEALHAASAVVNKGTPSPQDSDNAIGTSNNNILDENLNLCEDGAGQLKASEGEKRQDNVEYESDSDSDNLSIISGSITVSSDSDCDDNFVVVPMPAFFTYDSAIDSTLEQEVCLPQQNIGKEVASVTMAGENDKLLQGINTGIKNLLLNSDGEQPIMEGKIIGHQNVEGEQGVCDTSLVQLENVEGDQPICGKNIRHLQKCMEQPTCDSSIKHLQKNVEGKQHICGKNVSHLQLFEEGEQPTCDSSIKLLQQNVEGEQPICGKNIRHLQENVEGDQPISDTGIKYLQQNIELEQPICGKSIRHLQQNVEELQSICSKSVRHLQQEAVPQHADRDLIDLEDNDNQREKFEDALDDETEVKVLEGGSKVYAVDPTGRCIPFEAAWSNANHQSSMQYHRHHGGEQQCEATSEIYVNCSNQTSRGMAGSCGTSPQHASTPTSERNSPTRPLQQGSSVHILPETLVTGAIIVASSAYSTARAVINNLRTIGVPEDTNMNQSRASSASSSTSNNLKLLHDMGFTNEKQNVLLLQRYDNNLLEVIQQLLMPQ